MPRTTRQWAKRKLEEAQNSVGWTATHLTQVYDVYKSPHPEIAEPIAQILEALLLIDAAVKKVGDSI